MANNVESSSTPAVQTEEENREERLRYLQFVHAASIHVALLLARVYAYAKENAGPLKPGVQSAESTVKVVVGPVVDKYRGVPFDVLKFVDRKVDESLKEIERHVPAVVKEAPAVARSAAVEVKQAGLVNTATGLARSAYTKAEPAAKELYAKYEPAAKELYAKYEPTAEQYAVSAWRSLNRLPLVPQVMDNVVIPTASQLSERYNQAINYSAEKGYTVSNYLPLIPTDRIAKVFAAGTETAAH